MAIGPHPRMRPKRLGDMEVHALLDSAGPTRPASGLLRDLPPEAMEANRDWLDPAYLEPGTDILRMAYQSFLIRLPGLNVLVDAAIGEDGNYPARPDWHLAKSDWLNHLGLAGCAPEDVNLVVLTHLHPDHTGWLTRKTPAGWVPTFPRARHLVSPVELDFWLQRHAEVPVMGTTIPDKVLPIAEAGLFDPLQPGDAIAPGLTAVDLAGHSPGMIGLEWREGGTVRAAFTADLMHHPLQLAAPEVVTIFCQDPTAAAAVRHQKLQEYAAQGTLMFCNHFPGECAGRAEPHGTGWRFLPSAHPDDDTLPTVARAPRNSAAR